MKKNTFCKQNFVDVAQYSTFTVAVEMVIKVLFYFCTGGRKQHTVCACEGTGG